MNKKSDVKAKKAFCEKLIQEGYTDVKVISAPADIFAVKDGAIYYYEIKMTRNKHTYFGAATETEWAQAFLDPEHYRFVVAKTNDDESEFEFITYTPQEFIGYSTIPPIKIYFNIDFDNPAKNKGHRSSVVMNKENFEVLHKAYESIKKGRDNK